MRAPRSTFQDSTVFGERGGESSADATSQKTYKVYIKAEKAHIKAEKSNNEAHKTLLPRKKPYRSSKAVLP